MRPRRAKLMLSANFSVEKIQSGQRCRPHHLNHKPRDAMKNFFALATLCLATLVLQAPLHAQDMLRGIDLTQPAYSQAELSRADIEKAIADRAPGGALDFSNKSLNGLDLSGLDFSHANFHAARLNKTNLSHTNLDGANLDQAWLIEAILTGASLKGAHLFAAQMQDVQADQANFSHARLTADLTRGLLRQAVFDDADLSADMKNQSMGLMRAVLRSAKLDGANFKNTNLTSADLRFIHAKNANFDEANLTNADAAGADFRGASWRQTRVKDLDIDSAQIDAINATIFQDAHNLDRALRR